MKMLFLCLTLTCSIPLSTSSDYVGTWNYSINTPDGTVKGSMILIYESGEYSGKITAYGQEYEMTDIEMDGNDLSFSTNAAGYSSTIKGTFSDDKYVATISVEGMEIPMTAIRKG